jgi:hypothetical protein
MNLRGVFDVEQPNKDVAGNYQEAPRFLSRRASPEQRIRHYIETRWHEQYTYYINRANRNRQQHLRLQLFIAVTAVLVPVLLGFNFNFINFANTLANTDGWWSPYITVDNLNTWVAGINAVPAILSGLVAAATALENVQNYGANWRAFQYAADGLERERALFEANSGPYRKNKNPYRLFVERSEDVVAQETGRYFAREEPKNDEAEDEDAEIEPMLTTTANPTDSIPVFDDVDEAFDHQTQGMG